MDVHRRASYRSPRHCMSCVHFLEFDFNARKLCFVCDTGQSNVSESVVNNLRDNKGEGFSIAHHLEQINVIEDLTFHVYREDALLRCGKIDLMKPTKIKLDDVAQFHLVANIETMERTSAKCKIIS